MKRFPGLENIILYLYDVRAKRPESITTTLDKVVSVSDSYNIWYCLNGKMGF